MILRYDEVKSDATLSHVTDGREDDDEINKLYKEEVTKGYFLFVTCYLHLDSFTSEGTLLRNFTPLPRELQR